jgi:hypothetical protein
MKRLKLVMLLACACNWLWAQQPISRVEYFFDAPDPGFGKGTSISVTNAVDIKNQTASLSTSSLANGLHTLFVRSQNSAGKWSVTNGVLFLKRDDQLHNITKVEYFIDNEPGFGNGTAIPISPSSNISQNAVIDIQSIAPGYHSLFIRSMNAIGNWSITNQSAFLVVSKSSIISAAEYFIDTDPGIGKATPIAFNAADSLANFAVPVNITGLSAGKHIFLLRTRDTNGNWSITNNKEFTISAAGATAYINVNSSTKKQMCAFEPFSLAFDAHGTYNADNVFTVQLSDANGNFTNPYKIGEIKSTASAVIKSLLPSHLPDGNGYKIRVNSSNPVVIGTPSDTLYQLKDRPELGPDTLAAITCLGETVNLTQLYNNSGVTATWNTVNTAAAPAGTYQLTAINTSGCKDTALAYVKQKVVSWTGNINSNWHDPANWSNNRIPDNKTHVVVNISTPNICTINDADGTVASIQVKNGARINIGNNKKLTVLANCQPLPNL